MDAVIRKFVAALQLEEIDSEIAAVMDDEDWVLVAEVAGQQVPGPDTRAIVVKALIDAGWIPAVSQDFPDEPRCRIRIGYDRHRKPRGRGASKYSSPAPPAYNCKVNVHFVDLTEGTEKKSKKTRRKKDENADDENADHE